MTRNPLNTLSCRAALLLAFLLFPLMPPHLPLISTVHAATINVDSTCTFLQALRSANSSSNTPAGSCETPGAQDTILISGPHTIPSSLPHLTQHITIIGSNNASINLSRSEPFVLGGANGNLTVRNLTIYNARTDSGGAFYVSSGTLTIENSIIRNNETYSSGGSAVYIAGGTATIKNSVIHSNRDTANNASNAAVRVTSGTLTIENTTLYNNSIANTSAGRTSGILLGGGTLTLTHVTLSGNFGSLNRTGGTLHLRNTLINGAGTDCRGTLATNAGNFIQDNTCSPALSGNPQLGGIVNATGSGYYPLLPGSPAIDAAVTTHCTAKDQLGTSRPQGRACDIGAIEHVPLPPKRETEAEAEEEPYIPPTPMPPTYTGEGFFEQTGVRVSATHGLRSGVQFKRIGAANIGIPEIINSGFIDAIDIFGYVEQGVEVCFPRIGALIFLDAATSPRTLLPWPATIVDGHTCGRVDRPGTLVLVPPNSPLAGPVSIPQPFPGPQAQTTQSGLSNCFVTTTHILNLREAPGGDVIGRVNYNATLRARGRDGAWYQITVDGLSGWISADFTRARGNCA